MSILRVRRPWTARGVGYLWVAFPAAVLLSISLAQVLAVLLVLAWLAGLHGRKQRIPARYARPLALLFAWIVASVLIASPTVADLAGALSKWSFLLVFLPAYALAADGALLRRGLTVLAVVTVALFPYFIWAITSTEYARAHAFSGGGPDLGTNLMMAGLLVTGWLLAERGAGRTWPAAALAVLMTGLALSMNRSAVLGVTAGLVWLFGRRAPVWLALGLFALAAALAVHPPLAERSRLRSILAPAEEASSRERPRMWLSGLRMIRDRPLAGFASRRTFMRAYESTYRPDVSEEWGGTPGHVHQSVLQPAILHGIPGLGLVLWWFAILARSAWRAAFPARRGLDPGLQPFAAALPPLLLAVAVNAQFDYIIAYGQRAIMLYALLGLVLGGVAGSRRTRPRRIGRSRLGR